LEGERAAGDAAELSVEGGLGASERCVAQGDVGAERAGQREEGESPLASRST